jgi:recombination protein RecA
MTDLDALIAQINKEMKSEVLVYASSLPSFQRVTTGSLSFDLALGGGWPLNCWNEIVGQESNGKTVMALKTIAANQYDNPEYRALWVASEDFNTDWAEKLGVDLTRVVLAQTNVMEDAYTIMLEALDSQTFDALVLDSYPALIPTSEGEGDMDTWVVGLGARLTNKLMRKSPPAQRRKADERNCLCLIINQWRDRIGVMFGDPRTTPGGKGKNFSYFTRVDVARDGWLEDSNTKVKVGLNIKILAMKNKTAPPQRTGVTPFYFTDHGPWHAGDYDVVTQLFNIGLTYDLIERKGAWYHYGEEKWNGKDAAIQSLGEDLDLRAQVEAEVRRLVLGIPATDEPPPPSPPKKQRTVRKKP